MDAASAHFDGSQIRLLNRQFPALLRPSLPLGGIAILIRGVKVLNRVAAAAIGTIQ